MPRNSSSASVGDMLDDLKSRLGFNRNDDARDDGYDDYGAYGDYADEFAEYGPDYRDDAPVGGYQPAQVRTSRTSRFGRADSSPNLVSIDDVKMSTPLPDLDEVGAGSDAPASGWGRPSSSTAPSVAAASASAAPSAWEPSRNVIDATAPAPSSPSYRAAQQGASREPVSRSLNVIRPTAYGDVERVARTVRAGDVVVLVMRATPEDLMHRILDFSFGVASALDANVECPADKVFAIARGTALTDTEKESLRFQGAL